MDREKGCVYTVHLLYTAVYTGTRACIVYVRVKKREEIE